MPGRDDFLLIEDDVAAQRMMVSWPNVPEIRNEDTLLSTWARTANVSVVDAYRCAPVLWQSGLCDRDSREVNDEALSLVNIALARRLGARPGRRRPPPPPTTGEG